MAHRIGGAYFTKIEHPERRPAGDSIFHERLPGSIFWRLGVSKRLRAPRHLRPETARWWRQVNEDYALEPHHIRLLTLAAEAYDRCAEAREQLEKDGLTVPTGSGGLKPHPCVAIERDARIAFARLIRELDLDFELPANDRARPPALLSNRG